MLRRNARVELLERVPLFAGLSKSELRKIAAAAEEYDFRAGRTLTREGDRIPRDFTIIAEGTVRVERKGRVVARLGPGDFFGEVALIVEKRRTASVVAEGPVHALVLREREFRRVLQANPSVTLKVMQALGRRLPDDSDV